MIVVNLHKKDKQNMTEPNVIIGIVISVIFTTHILLPIIQQIGLLKRFFCFIGWHSPTSQWKYLHFNGASQYAECPWCELHGFIMSDGTPHFEKTRDKYEGNKN